MEALTNSSISEWCLKYNIPLQGMLMREDVKKTIKPGLWLVNLDDRDGLGTHWCGLLHGDRSFYFDPLGMSPPEEVVQLKPITYNTTQIQNELTVTCGYFVCVWFKFMHEYPTPVSGFQALLYDLFGSDTMQNEEILKQAFTG